MHMGPEWVMNIWTQLYGGNGADLGNQACMHTCTYTCTPSGQGVGQDKAV